MVTEDETVSKTRVAKCLFSCVRVACSLERQSHRQLADAWRRATKCAGRGDLPNVGLSMFAALSTIVGWANSGWFSVLKNSAPDERTATHYIRAPGKPVIILT
jgi:hypothetical protein